MLGKYEDFDSSHAGALFLRFYGMKPLAFLVLLGGALATLSIGPRAYGQQSTTSNSVISSLEESADSEKNIPKDIRPKDVVSWSPLGGSFPRGTSKARAWVRLDTKLGFTIYRDKLSWIAPPGWTIDGVTEPATSRQFDPISQKEVDVFSSGNEFTVELSSALHTLSESPFELEIRYVGCTSVICLFPFTDKISFPTQITDPNVSTATTPSNTEIQKLDPTTSEIKTISANSSQQSPAASSFEEDFAGKVKSGALSFTMMLLIAFIGGLLTNLTPCVAPMIPITIRLLSNQGGNPLIGSTMYAFGIVVTYTTLGVIAAMSGALFGNLIAHPAVSITFGIVMALLGFSMLGFGDLSKIQQIGGRIGSGKGSPFNAFLMGTGAGLVASPCTGPILAALLTYTAGRSSLGEATSLLGLYSVGFALPYVFLGASAAKISKIKVNHMLQISIKMVFAAVMFGLSLYFLRIPLYGLLNALAPNFGVIAAVSGALGLASMMWIILSPERQHNKSLMIIPGLALGIGLFSSVQFLSKSSSAGHDSVTWYKTESEGYAAAKAQNKPILVDAWAEWCEACKKMDATTFSDPEVLEELSKNWVLIKLDLTEPTDANAEIQERFDLPGLPTVTLLRSDAELKHKKALNGYVSPAGMLRETVDFRKSIQ